MSSSLPAGSTAARPSTTGRDRSARPRVATAMLIGLICLLAMVPFLWTLLITVKPVKVAFADPPVWSFRPSWEAYRDLWQTTFFYRYLVNTAIVAVGSTVVALVVGLPAAYALSRFPGRVSAALLALALIFRALPRLSIVLPMYEISKDLGIYDTRFALGAALVAINQPFSIWLLHSFFTGIPTELDEAAMLDGCSRLGILRRIMVPLMGPGILTAGIFMFLFAFQEYLTAAILADMSAKTVPVFIATQLGQTLPMLQQAGAATMITTLPVIAAAFLTQKYLVGGLNSGALKG